MPGPVTWTITDGGTTDDCTYLNPTTTTADGTISGTLTAVSTDGVYASACAGAVLTGVVTFRPSTPLPGIGTAEMTIAAVIVGAVLVIAGADLDAPQFVGGGAFVNLGLAYSVGACQTTTGWTTATWTGAWTFGRVAM